MAAPSLLAQAALPHLRTARGAIVNLSSTYGHRPIAGAGHYAASKAAIEHLTRSWALELAADAVRVNCLAPGPTESEALSAAGLPHEVVEQVKREEIRHIHPYGSPRRTGRDRRLDPPLSRPRIHLAHRPDSHR